MRAPRVLDDPAVLRRLGERWRSAGMRLGLVPTMGALHGGHRSLLRRARAECDRVVVSIFVNPAQFRPGEDLERYPRPLADDLAICAEEGADAVLVPEVAAMYPPGFALAVRVGGQLTTTLEGERRPGHFDGVAVVVAKLLVASRADRVYMGEKDLQQCAVVRRLAADLDTGASVVVCPVVRDADGLALSSRNRYLDGDGRAAALAIPRALAAAVAAARSPVAAGGDDAGAAAVLAAARRELDASPALRVEYCELVEPDSFAPVRRMTREARLQIAGTIGTTRLIDTICPGRDEPPAVPACPGEAQGAERSGRCSAS